MNILYRIILSAAVISLVACGGAEDRKHKYLERGQTLLLENNFDKAQIEFKNVLQIDPKSVDGWYFSGKAREGQKKYREAMAAYNEALQLDQQYHAAKIGMARIYLFAGVTDKALALSASVLEQQPDDADAKVVHASCLYRQSQIDQALSEVTTVLTANPDNISALALISGMYLDMNQQDQAELLLSEAIKRKDSDDLRFLMVKLYEDTKQFAAAIPHLQHLTKIYPDNLDYKNMLARHYDAIGDAEKAEMVLHAAVKQLPDNMAAKIFLIQFMAQKRGITSAHIELDKFIKADPDNADLEFLSAQLYLQNKDIAAAEKIWRDMTVAYDRELAAAKARMELIRLMLRDNKRITEVKSELTTLMKENPAFSDGMLLRGTIALNDSRYEEAINDFRAVLKDQPDALPVLSLLAIAYQSSGKSDLAEEQLKMGVSLAPGNVQMRLQLAKVLQSQQHFQEAIEQLLLVQKLDPKSLAGSEMLFRIYLAKKDYNSASKLTDELITQNSENASGYFLKAMLLQAQGDDRGSIKHLERALTINPLATEPLNLLARAALSTGQIPLIRKQLQTIVTQHPEHFIAHNLMGEVALHQKQFDQAEQIFTDITNKKPSWWIGWRNLAQCQLMRNQPDNAIVTYRNGVKASGDERLVVSLAMIYEQAGRIDDAVALYDESLKLAPASISLANNLALLLAEHRHDGASRDRALKLVKQFENSDDSNSLDTLGWVYYLRGEYDLAINALLKAEKLSPDQANTQYHLAFAYFENGNHDLAKKYLQAVIKVEPAFARRPDVSIVMEKLKIS